MMGVKVVRNGPPGDVEPRACSMTRGTLGAGATVLKGVRVDLRGAEARRDQGGLHGAAVGALGPAVRRNDVLERTAACRSGDAGRPHGSLHGRLHRRGALHAAVPVPTRHAPVEEQERVGRLILGRGRKVAFRVGCTGAPTGLPRAVEEIGGLRIRGRRGT